MPRPLRDHVPQRLGVLTHARIPRDDRHELWRFAEQFGCRKMHGIERADRFDGKGAADASEHRSVDVEDETTPFERSQGANGRLFLCCRQPTSRTSPDDRAARFCERQGRRHVLCSDRQRLHDRRVVLQQRRNERARLDVPDARPRDLGSAGARGCLPRRSPPRGATLRHDRCQSVQRRCQAAA